jgi:hypothetical protein
MRNTRGFQSPRCWGGSLADFTFDGRAQERQGRAERGCALGPQIGRSERRDFGQRDDLFGRGIEGDDGQMHRFQRVGVLAQRREQRVQAGLHRLDAFAEH